MVSKRTTNLTHGGWRLQTILTWWRLFFWCITCVKSNEPPFMDKKSLNFVRHYLFTTKLLYKLVIIVYVRCYWFPLTHIMEHLFTHYYFYITSSNSNTHIYGGSITYKTKYTQLFIYVGSLSCLIVILEHACTDKMLTLKFWHISGNIIQIFTIQCLHVTKDIFKIFYL